MAKDGFDIFSPDPFGRDIIYGLSTGQEPLGLAPPPQGLPVDTRPYDRMQATPRGFISGLFSDVLGGTFNMPQMPRTGIPAVDVFSPNINLFNRLALGDVQKTAERISYGEPLATGQGMTLRPRDETIGAALTVAPFVGEAAVLGARGARTGARMVGQEIADRVATGQSILPSGFAEPRPSLFAVEPSPMMPKPQAPVSPLGFYSAAEQAALNLQRTKGTGQSFLNDLMKAPDVKKDELQYTGLDEFLKDKPNVTKQEVTDYLANNKVDVEEVSYGNIDFTKLPDQQLQKEYVRVRGYEPLDSDGSLMSREEIIYELSGAPATDLTKYGKYQLAGGENYREILLKLPKQSPTTNDIATRLFGKEMRFLSEAEKDSVIAEARRIDSTTPKDFASSHFNEPNILAHMRVNDRVDADGKKMLLVEEIQSDWHQAGREKGYKGKGTLRELPDNYFVQEIKTIDGDTMYVVRDSSNPSVIINKDYNRQSAINGVINELNASSAGGVPDAPFKDTWYQLSLKRLLKYAADNGYERVGLTTGKQQADRYKLSNEVDEINVTGRTNMATGEKSRSVALDLKSGTSYRLGVDNNGVIDNVNDAQIANFKGKKLAEIVGKDIAKQIMEGSSQTIKGEGLNIGGEGMKKYYDEIYPKYLEKYGKKFDASVGETKVNTVMQRADNSMIPQMGQEPVRYIDITPKMKESVGKGQPLFTAIPAGTLGLGGLEYTDPFANPLAEDTTR